MSISKQTIFLFSLLCISKFSMAQFTGSNPIQQASAGNVAIGFPAYTPSALLQVKNGSVLFDGSTGPIPANGAGTRMMWYPAKKAFRVGEAGTTSWDDINIGWGSAAFGYNTLSTGLRSFAIGNTTKASGGNTFAAGVSTNVTGENASGIGVGVNAQSYSSFVTGQYNYNPGTYNTATWVATDPLFVIGNGTSAGATSNAMTVLKNGNTGIGSVNPLEKLDIHGTVRVNGNGIYLAWDRNHGLGYFNTFTTTGNYANKNFDGPVLFGWAGGALGTNQGTNRNVALSWDANGYVGVGTPTPTELFQVQGNTRITGNVFIGPQKITSGPHASDSRLTVDGKMVVRAIIVTADNWADYVFNDNYKLPGLHEVENYYKAHKHLPEIPAEKEVCENGINLSEMNILLLKKVEELTLYLVQQNKEIESIKKELEVLKK